MYHRCFSFRVFLFGPLQHAKEVYSQKDVIATQMKELQSRVSDVLHEGSKSVTVLDEVLLILLTAFGSS